MSSIQDTNNWCHNTDHWSAHPLPPTIKWAPTQILGKWQSAPIVTLSYFMLSKLEFSFFMKRWFKVMRRFCNQTLKWAISITSWALTPSDIRFQTKIYIYFKKFEHILSIIKDFYVFLNKGIDPLVAQMNMIKILSILFILRSQKAP